MQSPSVRLLRQPRVGAMTSVLALAALAVLWNRTTLGPGGAGSPAITLLAVILAVGVVLGAQFPIHVRASQ